MPSRVLFAGLPHDVREAEVLELLTANPIRLPHSSFAISALYNSAGSFTGSMILEVANDVDAERVRQQFSGQIIDGIHHLAVHHILPAHLPLPSTVVPVPTTTTIPPFPTASSRLSNPAPTPAAPPVVAQRQPPKQPRAGNVPAGKQQQHQQLQGAKGPKGVQHPQQQQGNDKPEGLKLLARLNKGGKGDQQALLEKQRAALRKSQTASGLLSRIAKQPKQTTAGVAGKKARQVSAADKVGRAKRANDNSMDVDQSVQHQNGKGKKDNKPVAAAVEKLKPKTAEELDAEMKLYDRQRRFAT